MILFPSRVAFADVVWRGVTMVAIDRSANREIVMFGEGGAHAVFADVPEIKTVIKVRSELTGSSLSEIADGIRVPDNPGPGMTGLLTLTVVAGRGGQGPGGDARISCSATVLGCTHEFTGTGKRAGVVRIITLVAVSTSGNDPVTVQELAE
jgi:hypothetical protein